MQIKFLKSIVENLINKQAVPIIDLLIGKKHVNEFLIAKKLNLTINQTRNILYKLSDFGLVSFIRKKDKRKGWYIYFWTLNITQSLNLLEQNLKKELLALENQLKDRKDKRYYLCTTCSLESTEENALLNNFACPECENVYQLSDNKELIEKLEKDIARVRKDIEMVSAERKLEEGKNEKKKAVKIKRDEKKVKDDRAKKRVERLAEKNKDKKDKKPIDDKKVLKTKKTSLKTPKKK
ncbi:MAG: hypothetical protein WC867_08715 [Candidatus Pacearchaeota archaeon]|jgi:transcription factor E